MINEGKVFVYESCIDFNKDLFVPLIINGDYFSQLFLQAFNNCISKNTCDNLSVHNLTMRGPEYPVYLLAKQGNNGTSWIITDSEMELDDIEWLKSILSAGMYSADVFNTDEFDIVYHHDLRSFSERLRKSGYIPNLIQQIQEEIKNAN